MCELSKPLRSCIAQVSQNLTIINLNADSQKYYWYSHLLEMCKAGSRAVESYTTRRILFFDMFAFFS